jgi:hypothetical protein
LPRTASGQAVVQGEIVVPTISVFTVGTTVSVPDRGGTYLGGYRSASTTSTETFPRLGRGFASRMSASDATAHVWIHDFQEMEEQLGKRTEYATRPTPTGFGASVQQYASNRSERRVEITPAKTSQEEPTATKKARDDELLAAKVEHAADLLKRGQDAETRGKLNVAKLYYKSVVSLGSTPSGRTAQERLTSLEETKLAGR